MVIIVIYRLRHGSGEAVPPLILPVPIRENGFSGWFNYKFIKDFYHQSTQEHEVIQKWVDSLGYLFVLCGKKYPK